jgi:tetratricopeptide (TPR) repeat protein
MSEKKVIDKKPIRDLLQEKDAFLTTSEKAFEYFLRHTKGLLTAAAVAALLALIVVLYIKHQNSLAAAAGLAYEKAMVLATDQAAGSAALEKVRADYPGRQGARLATWALIFRYAAGDETAKALPLAENLLQTLSPAEIALKPLVLNTLGGLYETAGDYLKSSKCYEAILNLPQVDPALKLDVRLALGRVYAATGQKEVAASQYQALLREFPQSAKSYLANSKLAELNGEPTAFPTLTAGSAGLK